MIGSKTRVYYEMREALTDPSVRYIDNEGGTRSGKTFSTIELLVEIAKGNPNLLISIVSETFPHLKRGAIRDFQAIMADEWVDTSWNKTESIYYFDSGSLIEFFSADQPGKVHGPARDILFANESNHIPWDTIRQLMVRTRLFCIFDYNPTHQFWIHEHIKIRPNCRSIHSTYKDNPYLTGEQIREIESNKSDKNWWRVYGEGKVGTLEGLIYEFDLVDSLPALSGKLVEVWGMDFGFSSDETAIVKVIADPRKREAWVQEMCYERAMLNRHIAQKLKEKGLDSRTPIYADCAEPKSIAEIKEAGFNVIPCSKDAPVRSEKLKFQIQWMQGWQLHFTKDSLNLIKEGRNYVWEKDKDGNITNCPIDVYNHALDGLRYSLFTRFGQNAGYGQYRISIR